MSHPTSQYVNLTQTAVFTCSATGYYNISYQWRIGSGLFPSKVTGINSTTLVIPDIKSSDDNTYTCVASDGESRTSSNAAKLIVTGMTVMTAINSRDKFWYNKNSVCTYVHKCTFT